MQKLSCLKVLLVDESKLAWEYGVKVDVSKINMYL